MADFVTFYLMYINNFYNEQEYLTPLFSSKIGLRNYITKCSPIGFKNECIRDTKYDRSICFTTSLLSHLISGLPPSNEHQVYDSYNPEKDDKIQTLDHVKDNVKSEFNDHKPSLQIMKVEKQEQGTGLLFF